MPDSPNPTIIVPYEGPCNRDLCHDVFVYLRPESNGIVVESVLLKVITTDPFYRDNVKLVYLANLPGEFIVKHRIIEEHYAFRIHFAGSGRYAFTPSMKKRFEEFFQVPFDQSEILGAFEALKKFSMTPEELFDLWVHPFDLTYLNGQSIKRYDHTFIVNADIPAILHKNNKGTDIAVMVLRSQLPWRDLKGLIDKMGDSLVQRGILDPLKPAARVFHFSKSPFEQLLDGIGYLLNPSGEQISPQEISFCHFLISKGIGLDRILSILKNPVFRFPDHRLGEREENLFVYTQECDYEEAYQKYQSNIGQVLIRTS